MAAQSLGHLVEADAFAGGVGHLFVAGGEAEDGDAIQRQMAAVA